MKAGTRVALRSDPTITGTVTGEIDTANFGRVPLVAWGDCFPMGEPEDPDGLIVIDSGGDAT